MPFKTKAQLAEEAAGRPPDFMGFREKYLARENFWYHHDAWKAIERNNRLIMLLPPGSTKTMTWSIEQAAYRLMFDRNFRILTIQKSAEEAVKVLGAVQAVGAVPGLLDVGSGPLQGPGLLVGGEGLLDAGQRGRLGIPFGAFGPDR